MMNKTYRQRLFFMFITCLLVVRGLFAADPEQIKSLLRDALKLYGDHQYVRALDLFKQVQAMDPTNSTAAEYIATTKQRIMEWETSGGKDPSLEKKSVNWDTLTGAAANETAANSKDIIAARRSLVERMKNRSTNTDNIVKIEETTKGLNVVLYHDQLFLPGLLTLRDEALPILENVVQLIQKGGDRSITLLSAAHSQSDAIELMKPQFSLPASDPTLPQSKSDDPLEAFQNIDHSRAMILFTYVAQRTMTPTASSRDE